MALASANIFGTIAAAADDCGPQKLLASTKLLPWGNIHVVPVAINGAPKILMLDTGGYMSQVSRNTVDELKLPLRDSALQLSNASGDLSKYFVIADTLTLGTLTAQRLPLMVAPRLDTVDGLLSSDLLLRYDVEMDFPGKKMNYFSQDHCKGKVVYWHPDAVAAVPITIKDKSRLTVPVKLDGRSFNALIDTGASRSTITLRTAKSAFNLEPGSTGVSPIGNVNGDPNLASYAYTFSTLTFGDVTVANPKIIMMPDRMATADRSQQTGNRALTNGEAFYTLPELILGMDVMKHLRMYWAFKESMLYVSAAAPINEAMTKTDYFVNLDEMLAASPNNPVLLNTRCFERAVAKTNLDGALADCELSLKLQPGNSHVLDSKGFALYQLGRYRDAIDAYSEALKIDPSQSASLFVRGLAKKKLGDTAGGSADVALAKKINSNISSLFLKSGVTDN